MPDLDKKHGKQEQRAAMELVMAALDLSARRKIEEVAERIVLLSDGAGQDVIEGISQDIVGDDANAAFAAIPNQYERALWLYLPRRSCTSRVEGGRSLSVPDVPT